MPVILRDYQQQMVTKTRAAFRDHDAVLLQLPTGGGKCLGRGTPVLMFDGRVKPVEAVVVGDLLMGPDSAPRRVLSICSGQEMLYRVTPKKGDAYVVNESHILSLRMTGGISKTANPGRDGGRAPGDLVNIGVLDYLASSATFRHTAKGWRAPVEFPAHAEPARLEAYFLGLWLGDGSSRLPAICVGDPETRSYIHAYADRLGMEVRTELNSAGSDNLFLVEPGRTRNGVTRALRAYGLLRNKHVPHRYLTGSRQERLQLLAGVLDSDGSWTGKGYDLTLKSERLMDDVVFVARSLGLAAYKTPCRKTCTNNDVSGDYWRCNISGDVDQIPVLIERKRPSPRRQKKNPLRVGIKVEPIGVGDYFGFEIDGDRLFMLGDFTVTHNTITSGHIVGSAAEKGNRGMFICNRVELLGQTAKTFDALGIRYGLIAPNYRYNPHVLVHIASIDTLKGRIAKGEILPPKLAVWDECRSCGAAGWARVFDWMREKKAKQLGLDATPVRLDGKPLSEFFGHLVHGPSYGELMGRGALVPFDCYAPSRPDLSGVKMRGNDYDQEAVAAEMDKPSITGNIVANYVRHARGLKALVFAVSREHSEHLAAEFRAAGVTAVHLDGMTDAGVRARALAAYERGEIDVICNVDLFTAGLDVPGIRVIIDGAPTKSVAKFLQRAGRGSRPAPGKDRCIYFDHAGNIFLHGLPDEDRTWTLEGRPKGAKKSDTQSVSVRQCPTCYGVHSPRPACPHCGHEYEIESREVEQREGELKKITKEEAAALRKAKAREVRKAQTRPELERIAKERGYSEAWVDAQLLHKERTREKWKSKRAEAQFDAYLGWRR